MQVDEFRRIVRTFADPNSEQLTDGNQLLFSLDGTPIMVECQFGENGDLLVVEQYNEPVPASQWIVRRLARLDRLAHRMLQEIQPVDHFVTPKAVLDQGSAAPAELGPATELAARVLSSRAVFETTVLYLVSGAGEGKTSVITKLARSQAQAYLDKRVDFLVVPIRLGGRPFLRFDDLVIGALQNTFRFSTLYYDSFIQLVKMGVVVPAFDGFEEMLVESSSGQAISAMGELVSSLDSKGRVLVAARTAYFDLEYHRMQERLFDSFRGHSVQFDKLTIERWGNEQFDEYCKSRGAESLRRDYSKLCEVLEGPNHALLTRAVLVKKLVDLAEENSDIIELSRAIKASGSNYFAVFVESILERESREKWVDVSGEHGVGRPLLSVEQHVQMLGTIALEMWESSSDSLSSELLLLTSDLFCEEEGLMAFQMNQIRNRISSHSLLRASERLDRHVAFDHDEFRNYFLGIGVARQVLLGDRGLSRLRRILGRSTLPPFVIQSVVRSLRAKPTTDQDQAAILLRGLCEQDSFGSHVQENGSKLLLGILNSQNLGPFSVSNVAFAPDSLGELELRNVTWHACSFSATAIDGTRFVNCKFEDCRFSQLRISKNSCLNGVSFLDCDFGSVLVMEKDSETWDPSRCALLLRKSGADVQHTRLVEAVQEPQESEIEAEPQMKALRKITRYLTRSTHISESVIRIKLGVEASLFIDDVLPRLIRDGVVKEIRNLGGTTQSRFTLAHTMEKFVEAFSRARGRYDALVRELEA